ncbi:transposase [Microbulbifer thermotolerans]|uniref:transposase n=1 Tax=Microbulbifer thermotolerans TaxID=252514 RepID=UPI0022498170|nr:transposase [Microbulbifer thermotolerans]MCX2794679.1 transposase [Microbulbifer thermotolerans]
MTKPTFDMDAAIKALREGKDLSGKDGILTPLIKQLTEAAMRAELEEHLASEDKPNRKNGHTSKTMKSSAGSFELDTPRDRAGTFEPQITQKRQTQLTDELEAKWGDKYPMVIKSWRSKWPTLSAYFKYPEYVRKPIYTTNAVEAVHRQFRKLTKTKGGFANENSLLKLLYAGILKASERWTHPIQNWNLTLSQLAIHFPERLEKYISL